MPDFDPTNMAFLPLLDTINERAKGELIIEYVGGPEVVPSFEQFEALRTGVADMALIYEGYYGDRVTGIPYVSLTELDPWEEREVGYYDLRVEILKEHNIYYLGKGCTGWWFNIGCNVPVETPYDLAGLKFRVSPPYVPFMKALGATPLILPVPDVYPALERGVVDGFMWACVGIVDFGWNEVTKYLLAPKFYSASAIEVMVNLDTWNKLPKHLQDLMLQAQIENEKEMAPKTIAKAEEERQRMIDGGMELIEFSPADTEWIVKVWKDASWEAVMEKIQPPELGPKLKELITK